MSRAFLSPSIAPFVPKSLISSCPLCSAARKPPGTAALLIAGLKSFRGADKLLCSTGLSVEPFWSPWRCMPRECCPSFCPSLVFTAEAVRDAFLVLLCFVDVPANLSSALRFFPDRVEVSSFDTEGAWAESSTGLLVLVAELAACGWSARWVPVASLSCPCPLPG